MRDFIEKKWFLLVWFLFLCLCLFVVNVKAEDINVPFNEFYYYSAVGQPLAVYDGSGMRPYNTFDITRTYTGTYSNLGVNNRFYLPSANIPVGSGNVYYGSVRQFNFTMSGTTLTNGSDYKLVVRIFNTGTNTITNNLNFPNFKFFYSNDWHTTGATINSVSYSYDSDTGILTIISLFHMNTNATGIWWDLNSSSSGYNGHGQGQFVWNSYEINTSEFTLRSVDLYRTSGDTGTDVIINQNNTIINQNSTQIQQNNTIIDKQNTTNQELNDLNSSINDDNTTGASGQATSYFSNFSNNTHGLTGIITLPLSTIQSLTSSTCSPLVIPIPFTNSSITLPCMSEVYSSHFPYLYNLWKTVSFGIISYFICIDIFFMVKTFKDPTKDEIEVLDL